MTSEKKEIAFLMVSVYSNSAFLCKVICTSSFSFILQEWPKKNEIFFFERIFFFFFFTLFLCLQAGFQNFLPNKEIFLPFCTLNRWREYDESDLRTEGIWTSVRMIIGRLEGGRDGYMCIYVYVLWRGVVTVFTASNEPISRLPRGGCRGAR